MTYGDILRVFLEFRHKPYKISQREAPLQKR